MIKCTGKRIAAYILDMLFVLIIAGMFAKIELINPTQKEYNEALEKYNEKYTLYLKERTNNDYNTSSSQVSEQLNKTYEVTDKELDELGYEVEKQSLPSKIILIVCSILYFAVFQFYNKGQTLGKVIMKIHLISEDKKKLSIWQTIIN